MQPSDWQAVRAIYLQGIATGHATFQTDAPEWEQWDKGHHQACRLVARTDEKMLGWAALSPVSSRYVYRGVAEVSVYVAEAARGQGVGKALLQTLVNESEQADFWTLQASIFPENKASIQLHEKCGFRVLGYREKIAQLHGVWRDTVLMERRSQVVGIS